MSPNIQKSENGGLAPELAATVSGASKTLTRFSADDEEYASGTGPRPDFQSMCYELAGRFSVYSPSRGLAARSQPELRALIRADYRPVKTA